MGHRIPPQFFWLTFDCRDHFLFLGGTHTHQDPTLNCAGAPLLMACCLENCAEAGARAENPCPTQASVALLWPHNVPCAQGQPGIRSDPKTIRLSCHHSLCHPRIISSDDMQEVSTELLPCAAWACAALMASRKLLPCKSTAHLDPNSPLLPRLQKPTPDSPDLVQSQAWKPRKIGALRSGSAFHVLNFAA